MEKWLRDSLSSCLHFDVPDDMIKYIVSLKSTEDFDEYFESLLNKECDEHRLFLNDCKNRLFCKQLPLKQLNTDNHLMNKKNQSHGNAPIKQNVSATSPDKSNKNIEKNLGAKKKNKYVNLYSNTGNINGDTILLKGRRHCDCQASQHPLINNCMNCGRIVCKQEGSGPCFYCGEIVCSYEEQQILNSGNTTKANNLLKSLKEKNGGESLKKALEQRDRLLEYDRNSEKRTTVIDDEFDYFQENSVWLSEEERAKFEKLKQEMYDKKHGSRINKKITIDFAGREVDNEQLLLEEQEKKILKEISQHKDANKWSNQENSIKITPDALIVNPNIDGLRPIYKASAETKKRLKEGIVNDGLERVYNRVQDKELLEMQDMRKCLSMHQPWASLLVAGIKKHEGRVWYSEHRGRLWIASTSQSPDPEEIKELEDFYKTYYNDKTIKFPEDYPTGCLLGCVKVEDCLPQEEYREQYPNGESASPYVFVCSNPETLPIAFPIKGQHKIYDIDPKIHFAACKTLLKQKVNKN